MPKRQIKVAVLACQFLQRQELATRAAVTSVGCLPIFVIDCFALCQIALVRRRKQV